MMIRIKDIVVGTGTKPIIYDSGKTYLGCFYSREQLQQHIESAEVPLTEDHWVAAPIMELSSHRVFNVRDVGKGYIKFDVDVFDRTSNGKELTQHIKKFGELSIGFIPAFYDEETHHTLLYVNAVPRQINEIIYRQEKTSTPSDNNDDPSES